MTSGIDVHLMTTHLFITVLPTMTIHPIMTVQSIMTGKCKRTIPVDTTTGTTE